MVLRISNFSIRRFLAALRRTYQIIEQCVEMNVTSLQLRKLARQLIKESLRCQGCEFSGFEYVSLNKPSALLAGEICSDSILLDGWFLPNFRL